MTLACRGSCRWFRPRKYWSGEIWPRAWLLTIWNHVSGPARSGHLCPSKGLLIIESGEEQTVVSQGLFYPMLLAYWTTESLAWLGKLGPAMLRWEIQWPFGRKQRLNCHEIRYTSVGEKLPLWFPRWDHNPTGIMNLFTSGWQDCSSFSYLSRYQHD